MPSFRIRFMGPITDLIGKRELDIQAHEGATLFDVFTEVERQYGESVSRKIIGPDGNFQSYVLVSVNGTDIRRLNGISTRLKDGDGILVALQIAGG